MKTLIDLANRCAKETERFFHGQSYEPQPCFELFRRAILEHDLFAWEAVYTQYQSLVGRWVQQHPGFEASGEEVQYFINRAFEKIWVALTPNKFRDFMQLGSLLSYLKMCTHSAITDHTRSLRLAELVALTEEVSFEKGEQGSSIEDHAIEHTDRQQFWDSISARLHDEKERQVVYGSFLLALKPREIYEQFRNMFNSIDEVYLIKQNVLARFRRDPELIKLIGKND